MPTKLTASANQVVVPDRRSAAAQPPPRRRVACYAGSAMARRRFTLLGLLLLLWLGQAACVTPSVPLPPPELSALSFAGAAAKGTIELRGRPSPRHAKVRFGAFNRSRGVGVLVATQDDGGFTSEPFGGFAGDSVELWFEDRGQRSGTWTCSLVLDRPLDSGLCR